MQITRTSLISGVTHTIEIPVTVEQLAAYADGALLQQAFPNLPPWQREFIKTGITGEEWQAAFSPEDEIELEDEDEP